MLIVLYNVANLERYQRMKQTAKMYIGNLQFLCKLLAMGLHYIWLCIFSWLLIESIHLYRMLTELRDVNHGHMSFYYSMGYGFPAVILGLSVGVRADQYGNYYL